MALPNESELTRQLRSDPRVIAALKAKREQYGPGFGAMLSANELAQLGYQVPADFKLYGNPVPRNARTDFENTAALTEHSPLELIPEIGGPAILSYGLTNLPLPGFPSSGGTPPTTVPGERDGVNGAGGGGSWLSRIGRWLGGGNSGGGMSTRDWLDLIGSGLGSFARNSADARAGELNAQYYYQTLLNANNQLETERDRDYWNQTLAREAEGRASGTDAWNKLRASQRVLSPAQRPQLSPYSVPQRQATDTERTGASAMSAEVMKRLEGGNQMMTPTRRDPLPPPAMDMDKASPGWIERIAGWTAPPLVIAGAQGSNTNTGTQPQQTPTPSTRGATAPQPPTALAPSVLDPNINPMTGRPYNDEYDQYGRY